MAAVIERRAPVPPATQMRRHLRVRGRVQGVGFRPFVYRLARDEALAGWVRNDGEGVEIEIQGGAAALARFIERLRLDAPRLARIDALEIAERAWIPDADGFHIAGSRAEDIRTEVSPDTAVCPDCLAELFDPQDRRYRYPFINCTQCGPRYTLTRALPYDRAQTSMAAFLQCVPCAAEYAEPSHRRFHAEPNACPACGPRLRLVAPGISLLPQGEGSFERPLRAGYGMEGQGVRANSEPDRDSIAETLSRLGRGEIVAIKGLGGFHLACDARNREAVARLRERKQREEKPFAVMAANSASLADFAEVDSAARQLLESPERPIVLLPKLAHCDDRLSAIAPGIAWLGGMLPYTPLHWLLFHEAAGRPTGTRWMDERQSLILVMTSANPRGEPLVRDNDEALVRLADIADAILVHDREIVTRCDDSVVRLTGDAPEEGRDGGAGERRPRGAIGGPQFIRRARGYTPQSIALARKGPSVLALGPLLKNTICLTRDDRAFVSQHVGDLDNAVTCEALVETVERLIALTQVRPAIVAHDLHPDFFSTRYAADFAAARDLPLVGVQHHHAHIAAVMAEHGVEEPVIGLALDGAGLGSDGGNWGGELLRVWPEGCERLGHLRELQLPGGDKAAREPWRMAASVLFALGRGEEIRRRWPHIAAAKGLPLMLKGGVHTPPSSSAGRWFDAAAGLAGVREFAAYEGQAAMLYEGLAAGFIARHGEPAPAADGFVLDFDGGLDLLPLLSHLSEQCDGARAAAIFHVTLADALAEWAGRACRANGIRQVALGGGCFLNAVLARTLAARLAHRGLAVVQARQVPPNDGGVSLGQAWVAMHAPTT